MTSLVSLDSLNPDDVNPFEMAMECHPLNPNFVLYCDVCDAYGVDGDGVVDDVVTHLWTLLVLDYHVVDRFLC